MKICYISGSFPPCQDGVGDFAGYISNLLPEIGFNDILMIIPPGSRVSDNFQTFNSDFEMKDLNRVASIIIDFQPDTILIEYPCNGYGRSLMINILPALLKLNHRNIRIAVNIHEYANYTWKGKVRIALLALAADIVLTTDKKNAILLSRIKNNVKAVMPVPPQIPLKIKNDFNLKNEKITFSYWGFIRKNKGLHLLFPAFKKLLQQNINAELKILADLNDSEYEINLKKQIKSLDIEDNIVITGFLDNDELSSELSKSDVCVLPFTDGVSDRRGSFKAVMAMGIPVISTVVLQENLPCGLINEVNVLLSSPDPDQIFNNMMKAANPDIRRKIGTNALKWKGNSSWNDIKNILKKVLLENENSIY